MPRIRQLSILALGTGIVLAAQWLAFACPYCPRSNESTLSEKLAEADAACVVKFLDSKNGKLLSMQTTTFEVEKLMKPSDPIKLNEQLVLSFGVTGKKGDNFVLMGQQQDGSIEWGLPIPLDELWSVYRYLINAPAPEASGDRLSYFLRFLDNNNPEISNDAFWEFARARFEDVEQLAPNINRADVRRWLEDPNPQLDVRRAFYGMLLGLCGNDDDAEFLERKITAPIDPSKNRLGIEGMMGGYLLLTRHAGLQKLLKLKVDAVPVKTKADDPRIQDMNSLRMTLNFLWDFRRRDFGEEPLRAAMRKFLDRPEYAETAIVDLGRWKDWAPLDRLTTEYGQFPWETDSGKELIVAYALSCRKDVPASGGGKLPEQAVKAQRFLDRLDPDFVDSVKRGLVAVPAALQSPEKKRAQED